MKTIAITLALLISVSFASFSCQTIGDRTYLYDQYGRTIATSQTIGDRTYLCDQYGRTIGTSQTIGDRTYFQ